MLFEGYHWEKEKNPENGNTFTDHEYGICILKEFSNGSEIQRSSEYEEHSLSQKNLENNETELNYNLLLAFNESFQTNLSGIVSQSWSWKVQLEKPFTVE